MVTNQVYMTAQEQKAAQILNVFAFRAYLVFGKYAPTVIIKQTTVYNTNNLNLPTNTNIHSNTRTDDNNTHQLDTTNTKQQMKTTTIILYIHVAQNA